MVIFIFVLYLSFEFDESAEKPVAGRLSTGNPCHIVVNNLNILELLIIRQTLTVSPIILQEPLITSCPTSSDCKNRMLSRHRLQSAISLNMVSFEKLFLSTRNRTDQVLFRTPSPYVLPSKLVREFYIKRVG